jgi:predicted NBD/HSP70 family sugar kinase
VQQAGSRRVRGTTELAASNAAAVMRLLRQDGPLSRAELARSLDAPKTSISAITKRLLDVGLIVELPSARSTSVGKPATPLWLPRDGALAGAAAVTATSVSTAVANMRGEVLAGEDAPIASDLSGEELVATISESLARIAPENPGSLLGVGIALPASCHPATGEVITSTQLPNIAGTSVADTVEESLGVHVVADEDARAIATAELWFGIGRNQPTFISIITGSGLGGGVVVGGQLYEGEGTRAIEVGHACLDPDGRRCSCGLVGCWETIASVRWVRDEADRLGLGDLGTRPGWTLQQQAEAGDDDATRVRDAYAENLAVGMANLVHIFSISSLVVHGDAADAGDAFCDLVEQRVARRVLPAARPQVSVVASPLHDMAGTLGAAAAFFERVLRVESILSSF